MDKESLYEYFVRMINSAADPQKSEKHVSISPVYVSGITGMSPSEIEQVLDEFVNEGKLIRSKLPRPPHYDTYKLPS